MTPDGLRVRRALEHDAAPLSKLSEELGYSTNVETMRLRIVAISHSSADLLLVAVNAEARPVACLQAHLAHIWESGLRVEIVGLIVGPEWRRRGIGRMLVAHAERWAAEMKAPAIVVRSNIQRLESHTFYEALDYKKTKVQQVYRKALG